MLDKSGHDDQQPGPEPRRDIERRRAPPRSPVAVIDEGDRLIGVKDSSVVHKRGLLHASVLMLVGLADHRPAVCESSEGQSCAGCLDELGSGFQEAYNTEHGE